jgi:hypothetical protein
MEIAGRIKTKAQSQTVNDNKIVGRHNGNLLSHSGTPKVS